MPSIRRILLALVVGLLLSAQSVLPGFPPGIFDNTAAISGTASSALSMSYTPVTQAYYGVAYTGATPSTSGGTTPYTYSISSGTLPTGFSLNTTTGVISGTDSTVETQTGLVLTVTDNVGASVNSSSFQIAVYGGPGDIVSAASGWYGLRAYNAAYAASTSKAIQLRRASDGSTQDIDVLASGSLNVASANSFAGTDAVCTATIASTTLTLTAACSSGTLSVGDTLVGAGITQPAYITAIGTCKSGNTTGSTCTLNAAQTVAVGETITAQVALYASKMYDQSGNSLDVAQGTGSLQPQFIPTCRNSLPCLMAVVNDGLASSGNFTPATGKVSFSAFACRHSGSAVLSIIRQNGNNNKYLISASANTWTIGAINATAADTTWHAGQAVMNGATVSILNIDGSATTGTATGNTTAGAIDVLVIGASTITYQTEIGFWDNVVFSTGNNTALYGNQHAYWGSGSC